MGKITLILGGARSRNSSYAEQIACEGSGNQVLCAAAAWVQRLIPGLTGDTYGAICELTELGVLIFFTASL
ncbi:MAG: adenosylcobinamide-GDP ribazoletransferase [Anaerolineae bacterium]|nr:adenosylcobinamide-GDP ribazoletransferase [Anaerolineae bacterium]